MNSLIVTSIEEYKEFAVFCYHNPVVIDIYGNLVKFNCMEDWESYFSIDIPHDIIIDNQETGKKLSAEESVEYIEIPDDVEFPAILTYWFEEYFDRGGMHGMHVVILKTMKNFLEYKKQHDPEQKYV